MILHVTDNSRVTENLELCLTRVVGLWRFVRSTCLIGQRSAPINTSVARPENSLYPARCMIMYSRALLCALSSSSDASKFNGWTFAQGYKSMAPPYKGSMYPEVHLNFARQPGNNVLDTATFVIEGACVQKSSSRLSRPPTAYRVVSFTQTGKSLSLYTLRRKISFPMIQCDRPALVLSAFLVLIMIRDNAVLPCVDGT